MKRLGITLLLFSVFGPIAVAQSNIDPSHKYAWCENVGWTNWRDANGAALGVNVGATFLSGFVWSENAGWINVGDGSPPDGVHYANDSSDSSTFGVNIDPSTGDLFGLAWGENLGWINFDTASLEGGRAQFDACQRRFFGFAWGENIGWINLGEAKAFVGVGPCDFADIDCDSSVRDDDYTVFQSLFGGPDDSVDCPAFDADADDDVDMREFAALQLVFGE